MRDGDGPKAAIEPDRDEQQQQGEPGDHLRHHQRRVEQPGEQQPAAEPPAARERHRRERAQDRGRRSRNQRHAHRYPGRFQHRAVGEKLAIPCERPAAPHGHQPRSIERIDHQDRDRKIEEGEAERRAHQVEAREPLAHGVSGLARSRAPAGADRSESARSAGTAAPRRPRRRSASRDWRRTRSTASVRSSASRSRRAGPE